MTPPRRLSIVASSEELRGVGPTDFERLARSASIGSREHRGLIHITATLIRPCIRALIPPSVRQELEAGLEAAVLWIRRDSSQIAIKKARARAFGAAHMVEEATARAVAAFEATGGPASPSPLDEHADAVTLRYARLSAHYAAASVCHLLDACAAPEMILETYSDLQGARAYQLTGLGSARQGAFRHAAWRQAEWESSRGHLSPIGQGHQQAQRALSVQIFHEYLGARYRAHSESIALEMGHFVRWALSGYRPSHSAQAQPPLALH